MRSEVVVIGGGATGTGILRDLALRGISAVLLEANDLASGTSSRFHGLLHSGIRYTVTDPKVAVECFRENMLLRKIAPQCIEETEGLCILLPQDDEQYIYQWRNACAKANIPVREITRNKALRLAPMLNPELAQAFVVPDGTVDGFRLAKCNVADALRLGGKVKTYARVTGFIREGNHVLGVKFRSELSREEGLVECKWVINAAGAWASEVAGLAGLALPLELNKGTLLIFATRVTNLVINRCRYPGDGDILVPHGPVSIFGTTSEIASSPGNLEPGEETVAKLLNLAGDLVPGLEKNRILRAFTGVRPLQGGSLGSAGRGLSRDFDVVDHEDKEGVSGFISVTGGKLTTYRLMAEKVVDLLCSKLGNREPCRTAELSMNFAGKPARGLGLRVGKSKGTGISSAVSLDSETEPFQKGQNCETVSLNETAIPLCECEQVFEQEMAHLNLAKIYTLDDLRRELRIGMGPCQGMVCGFRAAGIMVETGHWTAPQALRELARFYENRWRGIRHTLWGSQARQAELARGVYQGSFGMAGGDYGKEL